jgi:EmrB/QacA subfamily drug resistance transporter
MASAPVPAAWFGQRPSASTRWVLASLSLTMLLSSLGTSIANVGLPTLAQAFDASFQQVQWVVLTYLLAITTLIVSVGRLGDVVGRQRLMLVGLLVFTVASGLCAAAPRLWVLLAARAVQGLGAAVMMSLALALVSETMPKDKVGTAMGLLGTMSAIGTALGPSLGGVLVAGFGWRALFLVNVPLGLLALVLSARCLPVGVARASRAQTGFDAAGTVLLALSLTAYALAMTMGHGHFGPRNAATLLAAFVGIALFFFVETKATSPLIRLSVLHDATLRGAFAMSALVTTVVMATLVVGPFYLSGALQLDAAHVGLVLSAGPIVAALTGAPAGRGVDRFGTSRMTRAGLLAMAAGALAMVAVPTASGIAGYLMPLIVLTAGYAMFQAANNTAVMRDIAADERGVVSGLLNLSRNLGLITGASVMGALFAFGAATRDVTTASPASVASGMRMTFGVGAMLIAAALLMALRARSAASKVG